MKQFLITCAIVFSLASGIAHAHSILKSSSPTKNAMLDESPKLLSVQFDNDVRLIKLELTNDKHEPVALDFEPTATANKAFSFPIPGLDSGKYKAIWTIMGKDGHKMSGYFRFSIVNSNKEA